MPTAFKCKPHAVSVLGNTFLDADIIDSESQVKASSVQRMLPPHQAFRTQSELRLQLTLDGQLTLGIDFSPLYPGEVPSTHLHITSTGAYSTSRWCGFLETLSRGEAQRSSCRGKLSLSPHREGTVWGELINKWHDHSSPTFRRVYNCCLARYYRLLREFVLIEAHWAHYAPYE